MAGAIQAASIGIPDTLFIMLLALVVFGPRRLPEIGRQIGKLMYEFRKASNEFKYQMEEEMRKAEEAERKLKLDAENRALYPALGAPVAEPSAIEAPAEVPTENSIVKPDDAAETTNLTIQPPATGETVVRGKTMSQLASEAEELAEQTRTAIASNAAIAAYAQEYARPAEVSTKANEPVETIPSGNSAPAVDVPAVPVVNGNAATTEDKTVKNG